MDLCGFAVFQFSMDLCAFSYVMLRVKLRMYVSSLPYSTNLTYDKGIYFILFFCWYRTMIYDCVVPVPSRSKYTHFVLRGKINRFLFFTN